MIDPHRLLAAYQTVRRDLLGRAGGRRAIGSGGCPVRRWPRPRPPARWPWWAAMWPTRAAATRYAPIGRPGRRVAGWLPERRRRLGRHRPQLLQSRRHAAGRCRLAPCRHRRRTARPQLERAAAVHRIPRRAGRPAAALRQRPDIRRAHPDQLRRWPASSAWRDVPALPFELACLPVSRMLRFLRLPVVSYALPALVAIGQARFFHREPWNPLARLLRRLCVGASSADARANAAAQRRFLGGRAADEFRRHGPRLDRQGRSPRRSPRRRLFAFQRARGRLVADRRRPGRLEHVAGDYGPGRRSQRPRRVGLRRLAVAVAVGQRSIPSPRPRRADGAGATPPAPSPTPTTPPPRCWPSGRLSARPRSRNPSRSKRPPRAASPGWWICKTTTAAGPPSAAAGEPCPSTAAAAT